MLQHIAKTNRRNAFRFIGWQLIVSFLAATVSWLISDAHGALSALMGGLVNTTSCLYFAHRVFARSGVKAARQVAGDFYKGEAMRIVIAVVLMVLVIKLLNVAMLATLFGFTAAQLVFWGAPLIFKTNKV